MTEIKCLEDLAPISDEIRQALQRLMLKEARYTINAHNIGITPVTLYRFLRGENTRNMTLLKMYNYCKQNEL